MFVTLMGLLMEISDWLKPVQYSISSTNMERLLHIVFSPSLSDIKLDKTFSVSGQFEVPE